MAADNHQFFFLHTSVGPITNLIMTQQKMEREKPTKQLFYVLSKNFLPPTFQSKLLPSALKHLPSSQEKMH